MQPLLSAYHSSLKEQAVLLGLAAASLLCAVDTLLYPAAVYVSSSGANNKHCIIHESFGLWRLSSDMSVVTSGGHHGSAGFEEL